MPKIYDFMPFAQKMPQNRTALQHLYNFTTKLILQQ
jgi:hypothetical protein